MNVRIIQLKRTLRSVLLVLLMSAAGIAKGYVIDFSAICPTGQRLYYTITDGTNHYVMIVAPGGAGHGYSWAGYTKPTGDIILPEIVQNPQNGVTYTVNSIYNYAFYNCSGLTGNLTLPNSVTSIGDYAFIGCSGFTGSLTIPHSVTTIGDGAFAGCSGLTGDLIIPNSVTTIGNHAFNGCTGFTGSLNIPNSVTTIGNHAFIGCCSFGQISVAMDNAMYDSRNNCNALIKTSSNELILGCKNAFIPESITSIGEGAFINCSDFTSSLTIPNSVVLIGDVAFEGCSGITILYNAINCAYINNSGYPPFHDCSGTLVIGEDVESIPSILFAYASFTEVQYNAINCVGGHAFSGCGGTLVIGENVVSIPSNMFRDASFTGNLVIPNSVTSIGDDAFYGCDFGGSLTIGENVATIGGAAFVPCESCSGFTGVYFNAINCEDCPGYGGPFAYCGGTLSIGDNLERIPSYMFASAAFTGDLVIPNSVTEIGNGAFAGCSGFTGSLVFPNSVTTIGDEAFSGCSGFTGNLTIPSSVTSIGGYAFAYCSGFTGNLVIPNSVTEIGGNAFAHCSNFTEVHYNATNCSINLDVYSTPPFWNCGGTLVIGENVARIPDKMFKESSFLGVQFNAINCEDVSYSYPEQYPFMDCGGTLSIGNNVERIPSYMFARAAFTGDLVIPNSVISIGERAFLFCSGFTGGLTIPNSVTTIGGGAFGNCTGFTGSLTIPSSVTSIDGDAFGYCSGFTGNLNIPNSITTISGFTFEGCSGLTSVTIPNSVTTIEDFAFGDCSGLTSFSIPNSVISISSDAFNGTGWYVQQPNGILYLDNWCLGYKGDRPTGTLVLNPGTIGIADTAFGYCSSLTGNLNIPYSVTTIGDFAFDGCSGLASVTIPNSVTTIGDFAFNGCSGFTSINVLPEAPPTLSSHSFYNVPKSIPVYVPCGNLVAYQSAAYWNEFTNIQESCTQSQTIELVQGWNWCSFNVETTLEDLQAALVATLGSNASITIKSQTQNCKLTRGVWTGQLTTLDLSRKYNISVDADCEITLVGMPVNPAEHPVTINSGANWIAFPLSESMTVTEAFGAFGVNGDVIKSQFLNCRNTRGVWTGQLNTLEPGKGYIYNSAATSTRTFTFPTNAK